MDCFQRGQRDKVYVYFSDILRVHRFHDLIRAYDTLAMLKITAEPGCQARRNYKNTARAHPQTFN